MVDAVPTTNPSTADLTINADTTPTLTDLANTVRTNLGLPPRDNPTLTPDDMHRLGSDISRADLSRATIPSWADQHATPTTQPDNTVTTTPDTNTTPDLDTTVDLDAIHNNHAEQTPAGVSHHRGDPTMGDLPHRVPADPNRFTADTHITPDGHAVIGGQTLTPEQYGDLLRRSGWDGVTPIRLIGCDASTNGFADRLAQHLGVEVLAPTQAAWTDANGNVFSTSGTTNPDGTRTPTVPPDGMWQTHRPDGTTRPEGTGSHPPGTIPTTLAPETAVDRSSFHRPDRNPPNDYTALAGGRPIEHIRRPDPRVPAKGKPFGRERGGTFANPADPVSLDPNTAYRVTDRNGRDRGLFITDENGNIVEVHTDSGDSEQGFNPDLRTPLPNCQYTVDGGRFTYITDDHGRVVQARGRLELVPSLDSRRGPRQADIGNIGQAEIAQINQEAIDAFREIYDRDPTAQEVTLYQMATFDGGHLFATQFDGPGEEINMVPELTNLNRLIGDGRNATNNWRALEVLIGTHLSRTPPPIVDMTIDLDYNPSRTDLTPTNITAVLTVDGVPVLTNPYPNMPPLQE
ncbi:DNA/RNA non-specific endonuclease [Nocardia sp. NPDC058480]|uniref:DNA/RNA non-specific endonuclease n=1 Tax=unclassified Nocardia TaxID=2637762 RepID=UPI003647AFD1